MGKSTIDEKLTDITNKFFSQMSFSLTGPYIKNCTDFGELHENKTFCHIVSLRTGGMLFSS